MNQLLWLEHEYQAGRIGKQDYIQRMSEAHDRLWEYVEFVRDRNVRSISITGEHVLLTTNDGITLICNEGDQRTAPIEVLNFGDYEADERSVMLRLIEADSVVVDVGANVGWYCIALGRKAHKGKVIAFEPMPYSYGYLKKNLELNGVTNVETYNVGAWDQEGSLDFFFDPKLSAATSLRNLYDDPQTARVQAKVVRLDDVLPAITNRLDLLKCDVEGAELFVLRGAVTTLRSAKPAIVLEMLRKWSARFGYHPNEIVHLLAGLGYRCYYVDGERLVHLTELTDETPQTNFFFLDPDKHARQIEALTLLP